MTKRLFAVFATILLMPLLSMAQDSEATVNTNISFSFYAAGKLEPAGTYSFHMAPDLENTLMVTNMKTGQSIMVPVLTWISTGERTDAEVVFDKAGSRYYLTELYIPGQDGLLIEGAPGPHSHVRIKAKKNRKSTR